MRITWNSLSRKMIFRGPLMKCGNLLKDQRIYLAFRTRWCANLFIDVV